MSSACVLEGEDEDGVSVCEYLMKGRKTQRGTDKSAYMYKCKVLLIVFVFVCTCI